MVLLLHAPYQLGLSTREVSDSYIAKDLVTGINSFATSLHQKLAAEKGSENLFFSPYSISAALAMTLLGARGNTEAELLKALHWSDMTSSDLHLSMRLVNSLFFNRQ